MLAVKPQICDLVLSEVNGIIREDALLVSIAAGKPIAWIASHARTENVARFMPNMPAAVGEGMTSVSFADAVSAADRRTAESIAAAFGRFEVIPESLMDAATALAGSSPAFVFMMIEAMADAAVLEGMPRAQAYRFAAQAVAGSACIPPRSRMPSARRRAPRSKASASSRSSASARPSWKPCMRPARSRAISAKVPRLRYNDAVADASHSEKGGHDGVQEHPRSV